MLIRLLHAACSTILNGTSSISTLPNSGDISLENILHWPTTPVTKGNKQMERLPFVFTSTQWKKIISEKEEVKKNKVLKKEERKRGRITNKILKQAKDNKRVSAKCSKNIEIQTNDKNNNEGNAIVQDLKISIDNLRTDMPSLNLNGDANTENI